MKNLKIILATAILLFGFQSFAQTIVDGMYNSTFGKVSLSTEVDKEFPNGSLIYGDYRDKGTISGYYADFQKEIKGSFFNGSSEGKFIFMMPFAMSANKPVESMNGFWGYNSDNKNSTNANDKWNITVRTGNAINIKNVTNVWSGKWNTTDGDMHLVQIGNKISGRYKGIGTVSAVYNPSTRLLTGTFSNEKSQKTGFIKFYFEGNSFKGVWGWTPAMTEGNWDGNKYLKTNKELSKAISTPSAPSTTVSTSGATTTTYKVSAANIWSSNNDVYGFFGCKLYKVNQNGRELVSSFGGKVSDFYSTTENSSELLPEKKKFADTPQYFREYTLNNTDLNNNQIKFELELYMHMKAKTAGSNMNFGYQKIILRLDQVTFNKDIELKSFADGTTIFGSGFSILSFKVTKMQTY